MINFLKTSARMVVGVCLVICGFVGMFVPIPIVPFFLLIFVGLAIMGVKQPWVGKARAWFEEQRNRPRSLTWKIGSGFLSLCAAVLVIVAITPFVVRVLEHSYIYSALSGIPKAETAIVLGASVFGDEPSPVLEERLHAAANLYATLKVANILVSGDGTKPDYNETAVMRDYLVENGIPAEDIMVDDQGVDTYSSMYRAKNEFGVTDAIVVSQRFHLPRALLIAHQSGMSAYGFVAENAANPLQEYLREVPATLKAIFDLSVKRQLSVN